MPVFNKVLLLPLLCCLLAACSHSESSHQRTAVKVNVVEMHSGAEGGTNEYSGTIEESFASDLSFFAGGKVMAVYVKDGQRVRAGQLLAKVDNTNALNSYRVAKAKLDQARDGYDRAKQVYDKGSLPDVKWIEVQTQLSQAQSLADIARKNLQDCELRAPVAGTVSDRAIEIGSSVAPYQTVMRVVGLNALYVRTSIPEGDVNNVEVGTPATIRVNAMNGKEYHGVVEERNPSADPLSHSYLVRIRLDKRTSDRGAKGGMQELLPGMVCSVAVKGVKTMPVQDAQQQSLFEVPNRAVQIDNEGRRYVWVAEQGEAMPRPVTIADLTDAGVVVSSGLSDGDLVIVDGMLKVSTGTPVIFSN